MSKRLPKVKKALKSDMRMSYHTAVRAMAGQYHPAEHKWRYLTKLQADMVDRVGIHTLNLTEDDQKYLKELESTGKISTSKKNIKEIIVKYKDEDGDGEITFTDPSEARRWIRFMQSSSSKFEVIEE